MIYGQQIVGNLLANRLFLVLEGGNSYSIKSLKYLLDNVHLDVSLDMSKLFQAYQHQSFESYLKICLLL